ncbi:MAG: SdrD B-like domain-containing protein [Pirellulales bacterium]
MLDASFDGDGRQTVDFGGTSDSAGSVALDSQHNVIIGGSSNRGGANRIDFAVARLTSAGSLDPLFDGDGRQTVDFGSVELGNTDDAGRGVAIDSQDNVIVGGRVYSYVDGKGYVAAARLTSSGVLDSSFDGDGKQTVAFGTSSDTYDVAVDGNDNVILAGVSFGAGDDFAITRLTNAGVLDTTFDGDGMQTVDFGGVNSEAALGVAVDNQGNIIAVGRSNQGSPTGFDIAVARLTSAGSLDSGFSEDGRALIDVGLPGSLDDGYDTVAYQSDGKVLVVGRSNQPTYDFVVVRYNVDGRLDTSFGDSGVVSIDFGGNTDFAQGVALDSQGRILVAGYSYQGSTSYDFAVARLTSAGVLDISFDGDGKQTVDFGNTSDIGYGVAVDSLDNVILAGNSSQGGTTGSDFAVVRLTSAGVLDSSFDGDGKQTIHFGSTSDVGYGVAVDGDDNVIVAGYSRQGGGNDFAVARLNIVGALDTSFDSDGRQLIDFGSASDIGQSVALDNYGNVIVAGSSDHGGLTGSDFAVARLTSAGALDFSFDGDGRQTVDFGNTLDIGYDVALDSQGNVIVAGASNQGGATGSDFAVARLTSAGVLDTSFDNDGRQTVDFGSTKETGRSVAVDGEDNVILAGFSEQGVPTRADIAVARLIGDTNDPPTADAGGPYAGAEGTSVLLDASASNDPDQDAGTLVYEWDLDNDGQFDDATGATTSILLSDGPDSFQVAVRVTDDAGEADVAATTVTVSNVAPSITADNSAVTIDEGTTATNVGSFSDVPDDVVSLIASLGTVVDNLDGTWSWSYQGDDDLPTTTVTITAIDDDGGENSATFDLTVENVAPTAGDVTYDIVENSRNGTPVGTVSASDPGDDTVSYAITGGNGMGSGAFAIDSEGQITVNDSAQLDFETTIQFVLTVTVTDEDGGSSSATVTINLLNQASISGVVFVDVDGDGLFDANEPGIDGVTVQLLDELGNPVLDEANQAITAITSDGGHYLFEDLNPGEYQLFEVDPTGVDDGDEILGTLGGSIVANDTMQLSLERTDAYYYAFAELGQQLSPGDTATIGFWQNKHGQELIAAGGSDLANWLTDNFDNVFGDSLAGASGEDIAEFYRDQLFKQKSKKTAGPAKVDAQFMAVALATYFTSSNLAGTVAVSYGFNVTATGIGTHIVDVGSAGEAFGVADGTELTILQLLFATNSLTDTPDNEVGFAYIYDTNGNGVIDSIEQALRVMANDVYSGINEGGDI